MRRSSVAAGDQSRRQLRPTWSKVRHGDDVAVPLVGDDAPGTLTVRRAQHASGWVTVVRLEGEHDMSTVAAVEGALVGAPREDALVVDLSPCAFIDSSLIRLLVTARSREGGFAVVISTKRSSATTRILEITQLQAVLNCFVSLEEAQAAALAQNEDQANVRPQE
jgi:anti-anti-sigma factor